MPKRKAKTAPDLKNEQGNRWRPGQEVRTAMPLNPSSQHLPVAKVGCWPPSQINEGGTVKCTSSQTCNGYTRTRKSGRWKHTTEGRTDYPLQNG